MSARCGHWLQPNGGIEHGCALRFIPDEWRNANTSHACTALPIVNHRRQPVAPIAVARCSPDIQTDGGNEQRRSVIPGGLIRLHRLPNLTPIGTANGHRLASNYREPANLSRFANTDGGNPSIITPHPGEQLPSPRLRSNNPHTVHHCRGVRITEREGACGNGNAIDANENPRKPARRARGRLPPIKWTAKARSRHEALLAGFTQWALRSSVRLSIL